MTMRKARIHYSAGCTDPVLGMHTALCGWIAAESGVSRHDARVTCRLCLRRIKQGKRGPVLIGEAPDTHKLDPQHDALARGELPKVVERPRWLTVEQAISAWAAVHDEGASAGSTSDPARFGGYGAATQTRAATPGPVRAIEYVAEVSVALDRAFSVPRVFGGVSVSVPDQRQMLILRLAGTPVRVGSATRRTPMRLTDVADRTKGRVTAHQVSLVVVAGRQQVVRHLVAAGLLPDTDVRHTAPQGAEVDMGAPAGYDTDGWQEICQVISKGEDTARALVSRATNPLPIQYYGRRVVARRADLAAWVAREVASSR